MSFSDSGVEIDSAQVAAPADDVGFTESADGYLEWGDAPEADEQESGQTDAERDQSIGSDDDIAAALGNVLSGRRVDERPAAPVAPEFPSDQMPEEFDAALLNRDTLSAYRTQINQHFDQQLINLGANGQHPAVKAAYDAAKAATLTALDYKAKLTQALGVAYRAYQDKQQLERDLEPGRRIEAARLLAKRFGIDNHEKLLKHPVTGQPVNDANAMLTIASIIGERDRKERVAQRRGVDTPVRPAASASAGRSIARLDPNSKEFEAIERAVAAGKHVRLLG